MSCSICFDLDQSKILSSGNELIWTGVRFSRQVKSSFSHLSTGTNRFSKLSSWRIMCGGGGEMQVVATI